MREPRKSDGFWDDPSAPDEGHLDGLRGCHFATGKGAPELTRSRAKVVRTVDIVHACAEVDERAGGRVGDVFDVSVWQLVVDGNDRGTAVRSDINVEFRLVISEQSGPEELREGN